MSHLFSAFLFILLLLNFAHAQEPTPNVSPTPAPSAQSSIVQSSPPLAAPTPNAVSVKLSLTGIEISGIPLWTFWVLVPLFIGGLVFWFVKLYSDSDSVASLLGLPILVILLAAALMFFVGNWWGRSAARAELQEQAIAKSNLAEVTRTETPVVEVAVWPLSYVLMGFFLLVGLEVSMIIYIYVRWGSYVIRRNERSLFEEFEKHMDLKTRVYLDTMSDLRYQIKEIEERFNSIESK